MAFARDNNFASHSASGDVVEKLARTVSGDSGWVDLGDARELIVQLDAEAGTGTGPSLSVKLQTSFNGSDLTAVDVPAGDFTQVTNASSDQIKSLGVFHRYVKVVWAVAGTTPSFTFGVYMTGRYR